jgi:hypothetical protein
MDQTCPVVHKSRRPQARLKTVTLFYIHCELGRVSACQGQEWAAYKMAVLAST